MSGADSRKQAPALLGRVDTMLATYERRQSTNVPGTISLIRDLASALRADVQARTDARVDKPGCDHWRFVATDETIGQDIYAFSESPDFNVDECPTIRVTAGHRIVCEHEVPQLIAIVRGLAGRDPIALVGRDSDEYVCLLCPDGWDDDEWRETAEDVIHHEDCVWRRAKELFPR